MLPENPGTPSFDVGGCWQGACRRSFKGHWEFARETRWGRAFRQKDKQVWISALALDGDARREAARSAAPGGQTVGGSQPAGAEPRASSAVRGRGSDPGGRCKVLKRSVSVGC